MPYWDSWTQSMICNAYERKKKSLKEELQSLEIKEFIVSNILNDGPNARKQMSANHKIF